MVKTLDIPYKEREIDIAKLFRPVARQIALRALEEVVHALSRPEAVAGLSEEERQRLSDRSRDKELVRHFTGIVTDRYQLGVETLARASVDTERGIAIELLRWSLNTYRRRSDGDAIAYYERRIRPLFEALALPYSALLRVDGNLASCLPRRPVETMKAMQEQRKMREKPSDPH